MDAPSFPVLRQADADNGAYRGIAMAQMRILAAYMKLARLDVSSRTMSLANGVVITCRKCFGREDVFIDIPDAISAVSRYFERRFAGIVLHPRSGGVQPLTYRVVSKDAFGMMLTSYHTLNGVAGGWQGGRDALTTKYIFPLVDADDASFCTGLETVDAYEGGAIVGSEAPKRVSRFVSPGAYGNLYWHNDAAWDNSAGKFDHPLVCYSWKGTPTRHGRLPSDTEIPGLSIVERVAVSGIYDDIPDFTAFGTALYQGGRVALSAPRFSWPMGAPQDRCLVLGMTRDADGAIFIVTHDDHYSAPGFAWYFSDGATRFGATDLVASDYLAAVNNIPTPPVPKIRITKKISLTKGGFWLGVWSSRFSAGDQFRSDGWELVAEHAYGRNGLPWFGNASGTELVCSNGDRLSLPSGALAVQGPHGSGEYAESHDSVYVHGIHSKYKGSGFLAEYAGDALKGMATAFEFEWKDLVRSGKWVSSMVEGPYSNYGGNHSPTYYTQSSEETWLVNQFCAALSPSPIYAPPGEHDCTDTLPGYVATPCLATDYLGYFPNQPGEMRVTLVSKTRSDWVGDLPGEHHDIHTNYTATLCGVTIPIVRTDRVWVAQYDPHSKLDPNAPLFLNVKEDCVIEKSTIHYVDHRYGVCLYRYQKDEIHMEVNSTQTVVMNEYGWWGRARVANITDKSYKAQSTEEWHLVIDGEDRILTSCKRLLQPFGSPNGTKLDRGTCLLLVIPTPSSSAGTTAPDADNVSRLGCYEYEYVPYSEQEVSDGGNDHFYPAWCRSLQEDPFWKAAAARKYSNWWDHADPLVGTQGYEPPPVTVEPLPLGSFVRHPALGDMYQFLFTKMDGQNFVVTSGNLNPEIDKCLASANVATHDTTLYFPLSLM